MERIVEQLAEVRRDVIWGARLSKTVLHCEFLVFL